MRLILAAALALLAPALARADGVLDAFRQACPALDNGLAAVAAATEGPGWRRVDPATIVHVAPPSPQAVGRAFRAAGGGEVRILADETVTVSPIDLRTRLHLRECVAIADRTNPALIGEIEHWLGPAFQDRADTEPLLEEGSLTTFFIQRVGNTWTPGPVGETPNAATALLSSSSLVVRTDRWPQPTTRIAYIAIFP